MSTFARDPSMQNLALVAIRSGSIDKVVELFSGDLNPVEDYVEAAKALGKVVASLDFSEPKQSEAGQRILEVMFGDKGKDGADKEYPIRHNAVVSAFISAYGTASSASVSANFISYLSDSKYQLNQPIKDADFLQIFKSFYEPLTDNRDLIYKLDLKLNEFKILNLKNNSNINIPQGFPPSTGIQPIPPRDRRVTLGEPEFYEYNFETGKVRNLNDETAAPVAFLEFKENFGRDTYFPFVFDTNNPGTVIFGLGDGTKNRSGVVIEGTLVRNGGHAQLAAKIRGKSSDAPLRDSDLTGLYGGGFKFDPFGELQLEFRSRSVNRRLNGFADEQMIDLLGANLSALFRSSMYSADLDLEYNSMPKRMLSN